MDRLLAWTGITEDEKDSLLTSDNVLISTPPFDLCWFTVSKTADRYSIKTDDLEFASQRVSA